MCASVDVEIVDDEDVLKFECYLKIKYAVLPRRNVPAPLPAVAAVIPLRITLLGDSRLHVSRRVFHALSEYVIFSLF